MDNGSTRRSGRGLAARWGLALASAALALVGAELAFRLFDPHPEILPPAVWQGVVAGANVFAYVTDPELGYRPVLGNRDYSVHGTLASGHPLEKTTGVTRLLFLGDSVARQGLVQKTLRDSCPDAPIQIWTAAVEGYNTVQEVAYFLRYGRAVRPDHVTLLFHNNDFLANPVVFTGPDGELTVRIGQSSLSRTDRTLLAMSSLYRHVFGRRLRALTERDPVTTAAATRGALRELKRALDEDGVGLTVVLMPILAPPEQWSKREKRRRELGLEILQDLQLDHYDVLPALEKAVADGVPVTDKPGDTWHPNRLMARRWVKLLLRRGYLSSILDAERCRSRS